VLSDPNKSDTPHHIEEVSRLLLYRHIRKALLSFASQNNANVITSEDLPADDLNGLKSVLPSDQDRDGLELWLKKEMKRWNKALQSSKKNRESFDDWVCQRLASPELFLYEFFIKEPNISVIIESRLLKLRILGKQYDFNSPNQSIAGEPESIFKQLEEIRLACEKLRCDDALKVCHLLVEKCSLMFRFS
jgi:hypothetical protein